MHGTPYEELVAFILSVDRGVLVYLLPANVLFSAAVVLILARERKPLELVAIFTLCFLATLAVLFLLFDVGMGRPFARLEVVSFP